MNLTQQKRKRLPWGTCKVCGKKTVAPEDGRIPPIMTCNSCIALKSETLRDLNANRRIKIKSIDASVAHFPFYLLDMSKDKIVGKYDNFKDLRRAYNKRKDEYPESKLKITDSKHRDFTQHVIFPS